VPATKTNPNLRTAFFRATGGQSAIDAENGILRGVKLMEVGHVATFKGEDGKAKSVTITPAHIAALLGHAGNRALPIHETHEWFDAQDGPNADSAELNARIGCLKSFRKDEQGNLIADAFFQAGAKRDSILWAAEHNPEDTMFSAVFSYRKDDPQCLPINFRAADVVPCGAATTALFSDNTNPDNMPPAEITLAQLQSLLATPEGKAMLQGCLDGHSKAADTAADESAAAAMESDAGVTDADKKPEDSQTAALMRCVARMSRAFQRQLAEARADVGIKAEAAATALLGKGGKFQVSTGNEVSDEYTATLAKFLAVEPNPQKAAFAMLKKHPELTPAHENATRARMAKLIPQH